MAKTKKTSTTTNTPNLENTLQINGTTYNITATTATTAATAEKVQAALTITKKKVDKDELVTFDGGAIKSIDVVPAEGGIFTGPILVPNKSGTNAYAKVINETDTNNLINEIVNEIVAALKGLPNHIWDGEKKKLIPELDPENHNDYKALKIIVTENADDYATFIESDKSNEYPYIFICKDTGDTWLKTMEQDPVNITANIKYSLIGNTDGVDIEELTLSSLYKKLKKLSETNNTELESLKDLIDSKVAGLLGTTNDQSTFTTIHGTRKYVKELSDNLNDVITEIENGTTVVGQSTTSEQSNKVKVQTADGKTKYYSTIYFGSSAPASSLGNDGDIYIRIP